MNKIALSDNPQIPTPRTDDQLRDGIPRRLSIVAFRLAEKCRNVFTEPTQVPTPVYEKPSNGLSRGIFVTRRSIH